MFEKLKLYVNTPDYLRLRLQLWRRFGEQLRKIPEASDPDDLLQEAMKDLLSGRRKNPGEHVKLTTCLFMIVRGKVFNIHKKWKRAQARSLKKAQNSGTEQNTDIVGTKIDDTNIGNAENGINEMLSPVKKPSLRKQILALVADDALLVQIVRLQIDAMENPGQKLSAKELAEKLNVTVKEIFNANRHLKVRLEKLRLIQTKE